MKSILYLVLGCLFLGSTMQAVSWSKPKVLGLAGCGDAAMAMDPNGNAVAVWEQNEMAHASTCPSGGVWSTPVTISSQGQPVQWVAISVDSLGNAVAVWQAIEDVDFSVYAAVLPFKGEWSQCFEPLYLGEAVQSFPFPAIQVAHDSDGVATCCWGVVTLSDNKFKIQTRRLASGSVQWTAIDDIVTENGFQAVFTLDASTGDALVVWPDLWWKIESARLVKGSTAWSNQMTVYSGSTSVWDVCLAQKDGTALLLWQTLDDNSVPPIGAAMLAAGASGWQSIPSPGIGGNGASKDITFDSNGNAIAIWVNDSNGGSVQTAKFTPTAKTWSKPFPLFVGTQSVGFVNVRCDLQGHALAFSSNSDTLQAAIMDNAWYSPFPVYATSDSTPPVFGPDGTVAFLIPYQEGIAAMKGKNLFAIK